MFEVGDTVVHPQHGVGQVVKLEDREFELGATSRYYEISMGRDSTVWVPVDLQDSTLRPLASKRDLNRCREILKATPRPLTEDGRIRQSELAARLRQRTLAVHCEIVRDLSAFVSHKPAYGTITSFLEALRRVLCQEWAMVQEISIVEAAAQINVLLDKRARA
jgi:RNA polymerase-interacting CarD/CdnL/TRCF family regulator